MRPVTIFSYPASFPALIVSRQELITLSSAADLGLTFCHPLHDFFEVLRGEYKDTFDCDVLEKELPARQSKLHLVSVKC